MTELEERVIDCPYCGESIEVLIDSEDSGQQYIEDCQVCCRPITFFIQQENDGNLYISVHHENDAF
ncbi:CPXCG motif-containing cysteine-rich protein [Enterovibrio makurazakiensis]|uniref:CPXCG motif-containing cysteine-rich protein n=1 Tax=Enterovibrio gelatinilyticus TaxID=2899819 RepID=A0ABT5R737_9GAMM|nr:CPXCG motif-containing cysteine-rich protein [Enterovibrio sp. ZSDZ42]MDD1796085.1 CPXCG motif-containing cysteine-rich protein [Enterovibrio sp. ZSDZ42]